MKLKLFVAAMLILGAAACTQKTCPTYAKEDSKDNKKSVEERI